MKRLKLNSLLTIVGIMISLSSVLAQHWCAISEVSFNSAEEDAFNDYVIAFEQNGGHLNTDVKTIPVVVHVVYNNTNDSVTMNFTRIQKTIDQANLYLNRQNTDTINTHPSFKPLAKSTQIQLCLATKKPDGSSFNGVVYTPLFHETQLFDVKKYLNVIVDPNISAASASFPWELNSSIVDGVFIGYAFFGYLDPGMDDAGKEGKIFVHEIGHYLGLYHTFHEGFQYLGDCSVINDPTIGDRCADTPLDWSFFPIPGDTCDSPIRYCQNGDSIRAQVENYMHYNRDECLNMFSNDQRTRMRACLDSIRANLVTPENLTFTGVVCNPVLSISNAEFESSIKIYPNPTHNVFYIENKTDIAIRKINVYNQVGQLVTSINSNHATLKIDLSPFNAGIYFLEIEAINQKIVQKIIKQ